MAQSQGGEEEGKGAVAGAEGRGWTVLQWPHSVKAEMPSSNQDLQVIIEMGGRRTGHILCNSLSAVAETFTDGAPLSTVWGWQT